MDEFQENMYNSIMQNFEDNKIMRNPHPSSEYDGMVGIFMCTLIFIIMLIMCV